MKRRRASVGLIITSVLLCTPEIEADAMRLDGGINSSREKVCQFMMQLQDVQYRMEYLTRIERLEESSFAGFEIDPLSADCLHCHDGVAASEITATIQNDPYGRSHRKNDVSNHAIGMEYGRYATFNRSFKPLAGDTSNMIFVADRVGCLTCHDPLGKTAMHLVKSDRQSALCLTCHNK